MPAMVLASHSAVTPPLTPTPPILKREESKPGMAAHAYSPSVQEAEVRSLQVQG